MSTLATYIKDDLAARLRSGRKLPMPLTLDALAEHYDVSFTPVRAAIAELLNEGLLEKGSNRRLAPTAQLKADSERGQAALETALPEPPQDPHDRIVDDLVQLSLRGEAIHLREEATAEKYGLSRSAIRHILHRLAGEGILDHIPRHGWQLRPFRQSDLDAFIDVREVLELKALELARKKLSADELQRMLEANAAPSSPQAPARIDESLHGYLISVADNIYIKEFFERQGRYYRLLFEWEDRDRAIALETARQHREILKALLDKNWSKASKALSHHIRDHHPVFSPLGQAITANQERSKSGDRSS
ncbi:GntR family transcriptional regulator [Novipirellula galeiformis]|nr:GntR family transcriptional regulator [Novipirellula galeiformis]